MWKLQDFSVSQILREINFAESRTSKTALFAISGALNFVELVNFNVEKVQIFTKIKIRASKCVKMAHYALLESKLLISRKIIVIEKS